MFRLAVALSTLSMAMSIASTAEGAPSLVHAPALPGVTTEFQFLEATAKRLVYSVVIYDAGGVREEVWSTDGTATGTTKLVVPAPTRGDCLACDVGVRNIHGQVHYFRKEQWLGGKTYRQKLYRTDGTNAGSTSLGEVVLYTTHPPLLAGLGSSGLYMVGESEYARPALFRVDPASGITVVRELTTASSPIGAGELTECGGKLFITTSSGGGAVPTKPKIWTSDGTAAGTKVVYESPTSGATCLGGRVYFRDAQKRPRWTDGATVSPQLTTATVVSFSSFVQASSSGAPVLFMVNDGSDGHRLTKTDGTVLGTTPVKSGFADSLMLGFGTGDTTLFEVQGPTPGTRRLWRSDGSEGGTFELAAGSMRALGHAALGDAVYFSFDDGVHGRELWRSDGVKVGTKMTVDLRSGDAGSEPHQIMADADRPVRFAGDVFFIADDGTKGTALHRLGLAPVKPPSGTGSGDAGSSDETDDEPGDESPSTGASPEDEAQGDSEEGAGSTSGSSGGCNVGRGTTPANVASAAASILAAALFTRRRPRRRS